MATDPPVSAETRRKLDQIAIDTFRPMPDRKMLGNTYENVPYETLDVTGKGDYTSLYDPELNNDHMVGQKHVHTYEGDNPTVKLWRLKEFLGM